MDKRVFILVCLAAIAITDSTSVTASAAEDAPHMLSRVEWTSSRVRGTPEPPPPFQVQPAFPNLKFDRPLAITNAPATERLFVVEQAGKVFSFPNDSRVESADLVVDLTERYPKLRAIYGLAFHPDFETNRYVFMTYVDKALDREEGTRVSRFRMQATDPPTLDLESEQLLISWRAGGHNGGCLKFGPDGYLYISAGDSDVPSPPDPLRAGQDLTNLMSTVMRIDVDHTSEGLNYRIPADNPFVETENARGEIWAYGFRNPWKMSFDRQTGDLWLGDVGWELWELIHRVKKAGNYGWSVMEGRQPVLPEQSRGPTPILPPEIDHPHSEAGSITGGYVYHGRRLDELRGAYIYGDYQSGIVWAARFDEEGVRDVAEIANSPLRLVAFGEDSAGELLLVDHASQIYRLVPTDVADKSDDFPRRLSETGLFASIESLEPAPGVLPYSINAHHWADGTHSQRWMAIPGKERITLNDKGSWIFPDGSVLAKTIVMDAVLPDAGLSQHAQSLRLETQLLHRQDGTWRPYTYAWNETQTDAELVEASGFNRELLIADSTMSDGFRKQQYRFAARRECQLCHNPWVEARTTIFGVQSASPLAINCAQLGTSHSFVSEGVGQLDALRQLELVDEKVVATFADAQPLADPYDHKANLDSRARAWLHVNCAHCHQFNAGGTATISLAHDMPLSDTRTVSARPTQGTFQITDAQIIHPGDPGGSVLYYRVSKRGAGRMPRAGSTEVDVAGTRLIYEWISEMKPGDSNAPSDTAIRMQQFVESDASDVREVVDELVSTTRGALSLLSHITAAPPSRQKMNVVLAATRDHANVEVRDLFERFVPADQRVRRLGAVVNRSEILNLESSAERGRAVFFNSGAAACFNCHRVGDKGKEVGPDLNSIGKKYTREKLLTHILEPSLFIEPKYVPWMVETTRGKIVSGLLKSRSDNDVVLKTTQGTLVKIDMADVEQMVRQQKSIMPELLLKDMTRQQAADLLAFLTTLK